MIDIVYWGEDWVVLYRNKKKLIEGHSFYPQEIAEALGFECKMHDYNPETKEELWIETPEYFSDLNV